jgi:predicted nucleic acid-binding protein
MKKLRIYLDTSVIGGCYDPEFREASVKLMEMIRLGIFTGLISNVTIEELENAPERVRNVIQEFDGEQLVRLEQTAAVRSLGDAYLADAVVPLRYEDDALHVASATVHNADMIVSWNFKHLVNFQRIQAFNAVNLKEGYGLIDIRTPQELIYGRENEKGF